MLEEYFNLLFQNRKNAFCLIKESDYRIITCNNSFFKFLKNKYSSKNEIINEYYFNLNIHYELDVDKFKKQSKNKNEWQITNQLEKDLVKQ